MNILELLNEPGDSYEGTVVSFEDSLEEPSHYGILTFDDGNTVDLDQADNLRREMDGILDSYYESGATNAPRVRIVAIDPAEIARPGKDFNPKFTHSVILNPEGV